jgi:hypothetical protein
MDPEGILKACTTKVLMISASIMATANASIYSLMIPFFFIEYKYPPAGSIWSQALAPAGS